MFRQDPEVGSTGRAYDTCADTLRLPYPSRQGGATRKLSTHLSNEGNLYVHLPFRFMTKIWTRLYCILALMHAA